MSQTSDEFSGRMGLILLQSELLSVLVTSGVSREW